MVGKAFQAKDVKGKDDRFDWPILDYRNVGHVGHWLQLNLVGSAGNRQAIGARVTLVTPEGKQVQTVGASEGAYLSQGHYRLYFGLGAVGKISALQIHWPDGQASGIARPQGGYVAHGEARWLDGPIASMPGSIFDGSGRRQVATLPHADSIESINQASRWRYDKHTDQISGGSHLCSTWTAAPIPLHQLFEPTRMANAQEILSSGRFTRTRRDDAGEPSAFYSTDFLMQRGLPAVSCACNAVKHGPSHSLPRVRIFLRPARPGAGCSRPSRPSRHPTGYRRPPYCARSMTAGTLLQSGPHR